MVLLKYTPVRLRIPSLRKVYKVRKVRKYVKYTRYARYIEIIWPSYYSSSYGSTGSILDRASIN